MWLPFSSTLCAGCICTHEKEHHMTYVGTPICSITWTGTLASVALQTLLTSTYVSTSYVETRPPPLSLAPRRCTHSANHIIYLSTDLNVYQKLGERERDTVVLLEIYHIMERSHECLNSCINLDFRLN